MTLRLAITPGDAAGIGPRVLLEGLRDSATVEPEIERVLLGAGEVWQYWMDRLGLSLPDPCHLDRPEERLEFLPGVPSSATATHAKTALESFAAGYHHGRFDGLATGPISKEAMARVGFRFAGHTEFCADVAGRQRAVMFFRGTKLNVVLATVHLSLKNMLSHLNRDVVVQAIRTLIAEGPRYGLPHNPRLLLCGLNPHAGENGLLGKEELQWLHPMALQLRQEGIAISDPLPPDTVFHRYLQSADDPATRYDAVVALYHDQGLIPFKMLHFDSGVNISLGLPFVRTSPDHGTAFDLAATGTPSSESAKRAIELALEALATTHELQENRSGD